MPGIMVIEDSGGIKRPAWLADLGRGIRPAVTNDLIDANQKMKIHLRLHIQRCRAKRWGVKPGERLCRCYVLAEQMVCRGSPAQSGKSSPLRTLVLSQRKQSLAGEG